MVGEEDYFKNDRKEAEWLGTHLQQCPGCLLLICFVLETCIDVIVIWQKLMPKPLQESS